MTKTSRYMFFSMMVYVALQMLRMLMGHYYTYAATFVLIPLAVIGIGIGVFSKRLSKRPIFYIVLLFPAIFLLDGISRGDVTLVYNQYLQNLAAVVTAAFVFLIIYMVGLKQFRLIMDSLLVCCISLFTILEAIAIVGYYRYTPLSFIGGRVQFGGGISENYSYVLKFLSIHEYHLGFTATACMLLALYLMARYYESFGKILWIPFLLCEGILGVGALLCGSKNVVLSMGFGVVYLVIVLIIRSNLSKKAKLVLVIGSGIVIMGAFLGILLFSFRFMTAAVYSIFRDVLTFSGRTTIWYCLILAIKKSPMALVNGFPATQMMDCVHEYTLLFWNRYVVHLHNGLMQTLGCTGIPGLVVTIGYYIGIIVQSLRITFTKRRDITFADQILVSLLIVVCVANLFEPLLMMPAYYDVINFLFALAASYVVYRGSHTGDERL